MQHYQQQGYMQLLWLRLTLITSLISTVYCTDIKLTIRGETAVFDTNDLEAFEYFSIALKYDPQQMKPLLSNPTQNNDNLPNAYTLSESAPCDISDIQILIQCQKSGTIPLGLNLTFAGLDNLYSCSHFLIPKNESFQINDDTIINYVLNKVPCLNLKEIHMIDQNEISELKIYEVVKRLEEKFKGELRDIKIYEDKIIERLPKLEVSKNGQTSQVIQVDQVAVEMFSIVNFGQMEINDYIVELVPKITVRQWQDWIENIDFNSPRTYNLLDPINRFMSGCFELALKGDVPLKFYQKSHHQLLSHIINDIADKVINGTFDPNIAMWNYHPRLGNNTLLLISITKTMLRLRSVGKDGEDLMIDRASIAELNSQLSMWITNDFMAHDQIDLFVKIYFDSLEIYVSNKRLETDEIMQMSNSVAQIWMKSSTEVAYDMVTSHFGLLHGAPQVLLTKIISNFPMKFMLRFRRFLTRYVAHSYISDSYISDLDLLKYYLQFLATQGNPPFESKKSN